MIQTELSHESVEQKREICKTVNRSQEARSELGDKGSQEIKNQETLQAKRLRLLCTWMSS